MQNLTSSSIWDWIDEMKIEMKNFPTISRVNAFELIVDFIAFLYNSRLTFNNRVVVEILKLFSMISFKVTSIDLFTDPQFIYWYLNNFYQSEKYIHESSKLKFD